MHLPLNSIPLAFPVRMNPYVVAYLLDVRSSLMRDTFGPPHFIETDWTRTAGGEEESWAWTLPSGLRVLLMHMPVGNYSSTWICTDDPRDTDALLDKLAIDRAAHSFEFATPPVPLGGGHPPKSVTNPPDLTAELAPYLDQLPLMKTSMESLPAIPSAPPAYDPLADAVYWADELILGLPDLQLDVLRILLHYRTTLILSRPEDEWRPLWLAARRAFPRWIGFANPRARPDPAILEFYHKHSREFMQDLRVDETDDS